MPEMIFVTSSNIESIGYESSLREIHVRFLNGRTYVYHDAEEYVFIEFQNADSLGRYLNQNIKPNYRCTEI